MLIYLDNCSFNRPFDDQKQIRIRIETEAKLFIQENIVSGKFRLAWSYMLEYENSVNPHPERKDAIENWKKYAGTDTGETKEIVALAKEIQKHGIKSKDALHVACAAALNCDCLVTTDLHLIKKLRTFKPVKVLNPVDFINLLEKW